MPQIEVTMVCGCTKQLEYEGGDEARAYAQDMADRIAQRPCVGCEPTFREMILACDALTWAFDAKPCDEEDDEVTEAGLVAGRAVREFGRLELKLKEHGAADFADAVRRWWPLVRVDGYGHLDEMAGAAFAN